MPTLSRQQKVDLLTSRLPAFVDYKDHVVGLVPTRNSSSYQACRCVRADGCKILAENLVYLNLHKNNSVIIRIDDIVEISSLGELRVTDEDMELVDASIHNIMFRNGGGIFAQEHEIDNWGTEQFVPVDQVTPITGGYYEGVTVGAAAEEFRPRDDWEQLLEMARRVETERRDITPPGRTVERLNNAMRALNIAGEATFRLDNMTIEDVRDGLLGAPRINIDVETGIQEAEPLPNHEQNTPADEAQNIVLAQPTQMVTTTAEDYMRLRNAYHNIINDYGQGRLRPNAIREYLYDATRRAEDGELTIAGNGLQYTNDQ